jgi:hypothetical protein
MSNRTLSLLVASAFATPVISFAAPSVNDHLVVFGEAHLRRIVTADVSYYNELRTHSGLTCHWTKTPRSIDRSNGSGGSCQRPS